MWKVTIGDYHVCSARLLTDAIDGLRNGIVAWIVQSHGVQLDEVRISWIDVEK